MAFEIEPRRPRLLEDYIYNAGLISLVTGVFGLLVGMFFYEGPRSPMLVMLCLACCWVGYILMLVGGFADSPRRDMPITVEIKVEKTIIPRSTSAPGSASSRTRYVGILLRDGVEIYRSGSRPYASCARALAAQERADREKRGEL